MLPSSSNWRLSQQVIGIGSGSTVPYVVERILQQGREANTGRVFIPTGPSTPRLLLDSTARVEAHLGLFFSGFQSKELIVSAQLGLGDVDQYPVIDVTIDGADE